MVRGHGAMRGATALVFLGALLCGVAQESEESTEESDIVAELAQDVPEDEFVLKLTKDNFEKSLKKYERVLVKFSTKECKLDKTWNMVSKLLKAEQLESIVAKVDATVEKELAAEFEVSKDKYPTLKYFVKGKYKQDFDGTRDSDNLVLWMKNREDPPVKELKAEEVDKFLAEIEDDSFGMVAHIKKKSARAKAFYKSVEETLTEWDVSKIKFAAVWLPKGADPKADAKLLMHRPSAEDPDPDTVDYTGVWSAEKITWWAQNATYATLSRKFSRNSYAPMSMEAMGWTAAIVGVVADSTDHDNEEEKGDPLMPQVIEAMLPHTFGNPQWRFVTAEVEKLEDHEHELLGVKFGSEPRIIVLGVDKKKYHLVGADEIIDSEKVGEFLNNVKEGKEKPFYKSEPVPDKEDEIDDDGVLIVTGDSFEEKVLDETKDVIVEYYLPWCEHCKKLKPEWAKLAAKGAKAGWADNNVVVAKMDANANECDEDIHGFPKMIMYPAVKASKKFLKKEVYSGDRNAQALFEFVAETAKNLQDSDDDDEDDDEEKPKFQRKKNKGKADSQQSDSDKSDAERSDSEKEELEKEEL